MYNSSMSTLGSVKELKQFKDSCTKRKDPCSLQTTSLISDKKINMELYNKNHIHFSAAPTTLDTSVGSSNYISNKLLNGLQNKLKEKD